MCSLSCHLSTVCGELFSILLIIVVVLQHDSIFTDAKRTDELVVNTDKGRVKGVRYYMPSFGKVIEAYLGIPFAQPPLGHLRFRHPQPLDRWQGVYNATSLPNSCYQAPDQVFGDEFYGSNVWNPTTKVSEDCLHLNVWVPKKHPRLRKAAVLVWIFGGGFYSGTSTLNLYDGKILAAENDLIVVSIGYRVGPFGFLSLDHPEAPGNAGMFDQLMALDWVQRNIRNFGGDPNNVTLFGESAGSVSVSMHLLSPLSRSKFSRAIMQSGVGNMPWATITIEESKSRALALAKILNCPYEGDAEEILNCLRLLSAHDIVIEQWVSRGIAQFPFVPIVDGAFLVETPEMSLKRQNFKKCPIIAGSNMNEGSFFVMYELFPEYLSLDHIKLNREHFLAMIKHLFFYYPQYPQKASSIGIDAIAFQYSNWLDPSDKVSNAIALDNAVGDFQFTCNVNLFAHAYAEAGENVFSYYFTERYKSNPWPEWMGVLHGDEIWFAFGEALKPGLNFSQAEKDLSRKVMKYWTNFAKSG